MTSKGRTMDRTNIEDAQQPARAQERGPEKRAEIGGRRARGDANPAQRRTLEMDRLREVGRNLGGQLDDQVKKRPYVVIGAAAGVGFVAGSILGSRLGQVLLAAGMGYLAKHVFAGDLGIDRIQAGLERLTGDVETAAARERHSGRS
jgi:ElaB/YqjD/DUF883 family membrane-anchored ribosome-binding protein